MDTVGMMAQLGVLPAPNTSKSSSRNLFHEDRGGFFIGMSGCWRCEYDSAPQNLQLQQARKRSISSWLQLA
jgi:hypothetical protein